MGRLVKKMQKQEDGGTKPTCMALLIAFLGGLGIFMYGENLLGDIQGGGDPMDRVWLIGRFTWARSLWELRHL
jgi:hypothetical protein